MAPATSCGVPMRPSGTPETMTSENASSVAFIIFDSNGPLSTSVDRAQLQTHHANALTVMPRGPKWFARTRVS